MGGLVEWQKPLQLRLLPSIDDGLGHRTVAHVPPHMMKISRLGSSNLGYVVHAVRDRVFEGAQEIHDARLVVKCLVFDYYYFHAD